MIGSNWVCLDHPFEMKVPKYKRLSNCNNVKVTDIVIKNCKSGQILIFSEGQDRPGIETSETGTVMSHLTRTFSVI